MLYKNLITLVLIGTLSACSEETIQDTLDDFQENIEEQVEEKQEEIQDSIDEKTEEIEDNIDDAKDDLEDDVDDIIGDDKDDSEEVSDGCSSPYNIVKTTGMTNNDNGEKPEEATDDNTSTYWASNSAVNGDQELILDLGSEKDFAALQFMWLKSNLRQAYYNIQTSNDSTSWVTAFEQQKTSAINDVDVPEVVNLDEPVTARYIKYVGQGNSDGDATNDWNSIIEVEAFSCSLSAPYYPSEKEIDYTVVYEPDDAVACDASGEMLYNGTCAAYTTVYEEEYGVGDYDEKDGDLSEGAYLVSSDPVEMTFDALAARHVTENGNGWRHELKIKSSGDYRVAMTEVYELFKANIRADLDNGSKTIVAQHHASDTGTITKLYVADLSEGSFETAPDGTESNSIRMDGIFDVYIRLAKEDGSGETKHLLTTIESGEDFDFEIENNHGLITVSINGQSLAPLTIEDSTESYFKFGNYLQAQNPETEEKLESGDINDDYEDFYAKYFSTSKITFTDMSYIRTVD